MTSIITYAENYQVDDIDWNAMRLNEENKLIVEHVQFEWKMMKSAL